MSKDKGYNVANKNPLRVHFKMDIFILIVILAGLNVNDALHSDRSTIQYKSLFSCIILLLIEAPPTSA